MDINEKTLLAILKSVPIENNKLTYSDFQEEMSKICGDLSQKTIDFLINYDIINLSEDNYKQFGGLNIQMKNPIKYVNLTELGNFMLLILRSKKIMEDFKQECSQ